MNQEDVLKIANESGLTCVLNADRISYTDWANRMINFAKLVAAKEREACAKVCGRLADEALVVGDEDAVMCFEEAEDAIRARGEA
jgi:hypothetical protein